VNDYHTPAWLPNDDWSLVPGMDQSHTNGGAKWGTSAVSPLGPWVNSSGQPMWQGTPWGDKNAADTNPYDPHLTPNTGVTRRYEFTVSRSIIAPDGVEKQGIVFNGQFPGPLIEANWGDWIEVGRLFCHPPRLTFCSCSLQL